MIFVARLIAALGAVLFSTIAPAIAVAQDAWPPAGRITFAVPYGPGGYTDVVARLAARFLEEQIGRSVIV